MCGGAGSCSSWRLGWQLGHLCLPHGGLGEDEERSCRMASIGLDFLYGYLSLSLKIGLGWLRSLPVGKSDPGGVLASGLQPRAPHFSRRNEPTVRLLHQLSDTGNFYFEYSTWKLGFADTCWMLPLHLAGRVFILSPIP